MRKDRSYEDTSLLFAMHIGLTFLPAFLRAIVAAVQSCQHGRFYILPQLGHQALIWEFYEFPYQQFNVITYCRTNL